MLGLTAVPQRATKEFRQAAIHEAGHLVAIRALGGMGDARIWRNLSGREDEKAWAGHTRRWSTPTVERWEVIIGLAGLVAEAYDSGKRCPQEIAEEIQAAEEFEEISETDLALMGRAWCEDDVQQTLNVLLPRWAEVLMEMACLQSYASDDVAPYLHDDVICIVPPSQDVR